MNPIFESECYFMSICKTSLRINDISAMLISYPIITCYMLKQKYKKRIQ